MVLLKYKQEVVLLMHNQELKYEQGLALPEYTRRYGCCSTSRSWFCWSTLEASTATVQPEALHGNIEDWNVTDTSIVKP